MKKLEITMEDEEYEFMLERFRHLKKMSGMVHAKAVPMNKLRIQSLFLGANEIETYYNNELLGIGKGNNE